MTDHRRAEQWARIGRHLEAARELLEHADGPGGADYRNYLEHNELGLAFDILVEVGEDQRARQAFWQRLQEAAIDMGLTVESVPHGQSVQTVAKWVAKPDRYPCPCCGHLVFDEGPGSYDICPVCFWEDDNVQLRWPDWAAGANKPSLVDGQRNFIEFGVAEERLRGHVRLPRDDQPREKGWRLIDFSRDSFEPRGMSERPWPDELSVLYWWRPTFWRR